MRANPEIKYLKSFVFYTFNTIFAGFIIGLAQDATKSVIQNATNIQRETINTTFSCVGLALGLLVSFFLYRWIIRTQIIPQVLIDIGLSIEREEKEVNKPEMATPRKPSD